MYKKLGIPDLTYFLRTALLLQNVNIYGDINGKGLIGGASPFIRDHRERLQKRESL